MGSSGREDEAVPPPATMIQPALARRSLDCQTLLQETDWSQTSLGPREGWSPSIETMIRTVMASKTQDALWLGEECVMVYNQNYADIVPHPQVYGRSANIPEAWGPVWQGVHHLIRACIDHGKAHFVENDLLLYRRGSKGHYVEKYHTWSFIPIFNPDGTVPGIYNPTQDTTEAVLAQRRQRTTKRVSEKVSVARTKEEFFHGVGEAVEDDPKDVPFLICYSVEEEDGQVGPESGPGEKRTMRLSLESSVGVPEERHPSVVAGMTVDLPPVKKHARTSSTGSTEPLTSLDKHAWPIAKALRTRQCVVVDDCSRLVRGFPLRQWDQLPDSAIVIPICSELSTETPRGVLIMGLNLLCPLDDEYYDWIQVTRSQLTSALASVHALAAEQQRLVDKERLERAKTAWFQGAAHDLRSPLTLVSGPLGDVLDSKDLAPSHRESLLLAQRNVLRIQRLVNSLLDFSRIEAGRLAGRFVPIDLSRFVDELGGLFRPAIERRGIRYRSEIEPRDALTFVDPTLLETVITNLLSNSLKYTERGSITMRLRYTATHAEMAVVDTGFGIPQAELEAVTDRFHRATTALSRGTEGTGIGLALAKEIVRLHGGDLQIESWTAEESVDGSHGSTFTARIPLVERELNEDVDFTDGQGNSTVKFGSYGKQVAAEAMHESASGGLDHAVSDAGTESVSVSDSSRPEGLMFESADVILLADDNVDIRRYLRRLFAPFCTVVEACDGEEALAMARQSPPDLILSDLMMPRMNGQELLQAIRRDPRTRLVPMVLLSAATDDELRVSALTSGVDDFLMKPFKPKELLARVNLHMQLGKRRIELENLFAQREQEITLLSDYCPSGIIRQSADGSMIYGNAAWQRYTGMQDSDKLDNWLTRVDPSAARSLSDRLQDFYAGDEREMQQTWKWLNGRVVTGTFIRLDKVIPGMSGVLGCMNDITDQEERLHEAERRRIEAEESKRQQELLVDFTSHEIRTPVSAILQCSSLVKENLQALKEQLQQTMALTDPTGFLPTPELMANLDEDVEALESVYQCGLMQERIANDVLSLARIQLDTLSFHNVEVDLRKEGQKLVTVFALEAKMNQIELVLEMGQWIGDATVTNVRTDHVRVGQVITNLIANAIKFTAKSEVRRITVKFDLSFSPPASGTCVPPPFGADRITTEEIRKDSPVWLFVSVEDTGPGLSPSERAVLFQRFSQGSKMIHTRYGGSGLGLFICKKITEMLGGRIEVQSELGRGSVFRFFIECRSVNDVTISSPHANGKTLSAQLRTRDSPRRKSVSTISPIKAVKKPSSTRPSSPSARPTQDPKVPSADPLHVLIVEDNIINQTVLKRQMIKSGFTCDVADNGQEALDLLHRVNLPIDGQAARPYDVVFCDLEMPIMDGLTAIKTIREEERTGELSPRQLVIALTGNARPAQIDSALAAGMDDVVIKPYRLPDLIEKARKGLIKAKGDVSAS